MSAPSAFGQAKALFRNNVVLFRWFYSENKYQNKVVFDDSKVPIGTTEEGSTRIKRAANAKAVFIKAEAALPSVETCKSFDGCFEGRIDTSG